MRVLNLVLMTSIFLLAGCATQQTVDSQGPTPAQLSTSKDQTIKGQYFTWGGTIVSVTNKSDRTVLEILAYPLSSSGEPQTGRQPSGRFLADRSGFLEPEEYEPGKRITVSGPLLGYKDGLVGESPYTYPALDAQELKLFQDIPEIYDNRRPRFNLGIGVGSHGRSSVGIGVGF